ncbi:hypothetical protein [Pseudomonas sp. N40(2020)]|uniref:hypothetical protein n=1 Tax=Pseudomonas sp. N40(2020) TaxID=2767798 RepID=UPI001CA43A92|nr:hypothetical protein [Pseudomonas sp. N40(2020)]
MERDDSCRISASTAKRAGNTPSAGQIANAVVATFGDIHTILAPIIGQEGVFALYRRSVFICASRHTCLSILNDSLEKDFSGLRLLLAQQTSDTATTYGDDLLKTLNELLISFIGSSLSERLLQAVWENSLSDTPAQDTSS